MLSCSVVATCPRPPLPLQDYGYPQSTSTEMLKMYVHNEPVPVEMARGGAGAGAGKKTISSTAVQKPISLSTASTGKKNEIFVDILERLTVLFNANVSAPRHAETTCSRTAG
jgi:AP-4 complex subunit mu-1